MKRVAYILIAVGFINFAMYGIAALLIGGDAVNGKAENGRYFVAEHGRYTEVPQWVFAYSRFHAYSVWVTHPLLIFGLLFLVAEKHWRPRRELGQHE